MKVEIQDMDSKDIQIQIKLAENSRTSMKRMHRILHATDLSKASGRAFARAVDLATHERAELLILHVMGPPASFVASEPPADYLAFLAEARQDTARRLAAVLARAKRSGIRAEAKLVEGVPAQQIVRMARRRDSDLIVIGTHGRSGLGRLLMGSVAERVLQLAPCPVLTVRGR